MHRGRVLMEFGALAPYEAALRTGGPLELRTADGRVLVLDVDQWLRAADTADRSVLRRSAGPVLDVGCGPGRFVAALHSAGVTALGVDIAETAVALTRGLGMPALLRSVFADLPDEGGWATVLLVDGNIGIGGDPLRLLTRVAALLAPGGRVLIETDRNPASDERLSAQFVEHGQAVGPVFDWAMVGAPALARYAAQAGYQFDESWTSSGRTFVALTR